MSRIAYVNGRYVPHAHACVHIEDRGYQFADGVYEVIAVVGGRLVDLDAHLDRLARSCAELRIAPPMGRPALAHVLAEMVRRNRLGGGGMVYLQVTRGVAPRDHAFPADARPALVVTARRMRPVAPALIERGVGVITLPDIRWGRCDIKTVALLANILGKQTAVESGAFEAWLVDAAGNITEGTSSNAWIVDAAGVLRTRQADRAILSGITRLSLIDLARDAGVTFAEGPFTPAEAGAAREAFLTSTTAMVVPVVSIDERPIGDGRPGPVTRRLRAAYLAAIAGPDGEGAR
ncbi:MAG: D-amino-acid transaminase [Alphaproteobacteria bacterium]|nr:D-amino-acid transaminase [Alphaproteobacteria bacterium]